MELKRPSQSELDQTSPAEKDMLIYMLFDALNDLGKRVKQLENKTGNVSGKPRF
ncbi:hypothetical protein [Methylomonas sp. AM2-LC]|uniref:hypothetical protein n=1 Tax=Methylomonas sp. AM2-LC TaxID=3153301 RepID=UPI003263F0BF